MATLDLVLACAFLAFMLAISVVALLASFFFGWAVGTVLWRAAVLIGALPW